MHISRLTPSNPDAVLPYKVKGCFISFWFILEDFSNEDSTVSQQETSSVQKPKQSVDEQMALRESLVRFSVFGLAALALSFVVNFSLFCVCVLLQRHIILC